MLLRALRARETVHGEKRIRLDDLIVEAREAHLNTLFRDATGALVSGKGEHTSSGQHFVGRNNAISLWVRSRQRGVLIKVWRVRMQRTIQATLIVFHKWIQGTMSYDMDDRSVEWWTMGDKKRKCHCSLRTTFGSFLLDLFHHPDRVALFSKH